MTKFETMEQVNANFVELTDQELMDVDGSGVLVTGLVIGGTLLAGVTWGFFMG